MPVEIADHHPGPDLVAAGLLVPLVRDACAIEETAKLPLPGKHFGLVAPAEWVGRGGAGTGDQEDPLAAVALDVLDRVVDADLVSSQGSQ